MSYRDTVLADNPVSYWRLGEASGTTAADEKAANAGSYVGAPTLGSTGLLVGDPDTAVGLNGSTQYVSVPDSASLDVTNITLEAWVKPTALFTPLIVTKASAYYFKQVAAGFEFGLVNGGGSFFVVSSSAAPAVGRTYHLVGTFDGTTQRFYIDGVEVGVAIPGATAAPAANANPFVLGGWSGAEFTGTLDEVAVYSTALSAERVLTHYMVGAPITVTYTRASMRKVA